LKSRLGNQNICSCGQTFLSRLTVMVEGFVVVVVIVLGICFMVGHAGSAMKRSISGCRVDM
jgi:hypothetical protein